MTPCTAINPGLDAGTCAFDPCLGRHSFEPEPPADEPTVPVMMPDGQLPADLVRTASAMSQAAPLEQVIEDQATDRADGKYQDERGRWHNANGGFCAAPDA
ncbi:MAG: hypothetical protein ACYC2H_09915 [Thermoplasmatota archaeon]